MEIKMLKIGDIKPYEKNPRKNDASVEYVANSIKEFGFKVPIVIDKNNVIVTGHTRYKAGKKLELKEVPCIMADDLTDEQIKAYRLADNKVGESSEWDFDLLDGELADILTIDMEQFDFDLSLDEEETEVVEDDFDEELPEEPKAKRGEIYQLGNHRLMCGDSTSREDVEKLMDGEKADMVFTDPPYGYKYQSNMREKTEKFDVIENDDKILDFFPNIKEFCEGFVFICTTWKVIDKWIELFKNYFELTNTIIWDKGGGGMGDLEHTFSTDYEVILCSNNGKEIKGHRYGSVWNFTKQEIQKMKKEELLSIVMNIKEYQSVWKIKKDNASDYIHPTQKPVALSARAIRSTTDINCNVLDLFGGSGSTMMACEQIKRNCYIMEYDERYVDVIIARWEKFTGQKAILLNGSEVSGE